MILVLLHSRNTRSLIALSCHASVYAVVFTIYVAYTVMDFQLLLAVVDLGTEANYRIKIFNVKTCAGRGIQSRYSAVVFVVCVIENPAQKIEVFFFIKKPNQ